MKNNHLIIILTIILFIPFAVIAGIKGFVVGIIEQADNECERNKTKLTKLSK